MTQLFETLRSATAALGMAFVLGAGSAAAATLDQFTPVSGGATIFGTGSATLSSTGIGFVGSGVASGGNISVPVVLPNNILNLTASGSGSDITSGNFASNTLLPTTPTQTLVTFLSGSFEDARAESGILSFLFAVNGGSTASSFGSHVIYTLNNPGFTTDTFAKLSLILAPNTGSVVPVNFSISEAAVIPLPTGLVLLLTGLGAIALARRRVASRKWWKFSGGVLKAV